MNYFRNNINISARLGPITGVLNNKNFIRRIKPLYFLTEKEVTTYSYIMGFMDNYMECPHNSQSYRGHIRDMINDFESKYPGTKHGIITSFLEILPLLKANVDYNKDLKSCSVCGEPSSKDVCQACNYAETIVNKMK